MPTQAIILHCWLRSSLHFNQTCLLVDLNKYKSASRTTYYKYGILRMQSFETWLLKSVYMKKPLENYIFWYAIPVSVWRPVPHYLYTDTPLIGPVY